MMGVCMSRWATASTHVNHSGNSAAPGAFTLGGTACTVG